MSDLGSMLSQFTGWVSDPTILLIFFLVVVLLFSDSFSDICAPGGFLGGLFNDPTILFLVIALVVVFIPGFI